MTIEVNDSEVLAAFNRMLAAVESPTPALSAIGAALRRSTAERFRTSEGPSGAAWAPLSPVTLALRRQGASATSKAGKALAAVRAAKGLGGGGAKPLLDTGLLANSISYHVGADYVEVGTNVIYGRMQHFGAAKGAFGRTSRGAPIPWGNVPARPWLGLSDEDRRTVLEIFSDAIRRGAAP